MGVKLYPPVIEGTIPAFCTKGTSTKIEVPFVMNKAVGEADFTGFKLKIRNINGTEIGVVTSNSKSSSNLVTFNLQAIASKLIIGQYYKVQLAYYRREASEETIGYYSTVGVVKYTSAPQIFIDNLNERVINNHNYHYVGVYRQVPKNANDIVDTTEKLYSTRFYVTRSDGTIYKDSGEILHLPSSDSLSYEAHEDFLLAEDLPLDESFQLYFEAKTSNGLVLQSPSYTICQRRQIPMSLNADLITTNDYESGAILVNLVAHKASEIATGNFLLSRAASDENFAWKEIKYFALQSEMPTRLLIKDCTVVQGVTYKYAIQQYNSHGIYSDKKTSQEITADFEDIFLFDGTRQLRVKYNPKVSTLKNTLIESKVDTIGSQFPFIMRNGQVKYKELAISGLVSYQMDDIENFMSWEKDLGIKGKMTDLIGENIKAERFFKLNVLEWLTNGQPKLFRSPTEGNYIVRLMNVSMAPNDTVGRMLHTFTANAYEIAEFNYKNLDKYGMLDLTPIERKQTKWATIDLSAPNSYTPNESILSREIYSIQILDMMPGVIIYIGSPDNSFAIGATGSFYAEFEDPITDMGIVSEGVSSGLITYSYKTIATDIFDEINSISIQTIPCRRFIGNKYKYDDAAIQKVITILSTLKTNDVISVEDYDAIISYEPEWQFYFGEITTQLANGTIELTYRFSGVAADLLSTIKNNNDNLLAYMQDVKTTILTFNYIRAYKRDCLPLYIDKSSNIDFNKEFNGDFYLDSHNYSSLNSTNYTPGVLTSDITISASDLDSWDLYKVYYRRENFEYKDIKGEGYYVDANGDIFFPFTGYYYDPNSKHFILDENNIFSLNINDQNISVENTEYFSTKQITDCDYLSIGAGVILDIGYQEQESFYGVENDTTILPNDKKSLYQYKKDYETARDKYVNIRIGKRYNSTLKTYEFKEANLPSQKEIDEAYNSMNQKYNIFILKLDAVLNAGKED